MLFLRVLGSLDTLLFSFSSLCASLVSHHISRLLASKRLARIVETFPWVMVVLVWTASYLFRLVVAFPLFLFYFFFLFPHSYDLTIPIIGRHHKHDAGRGNAGTLHHHRILMDRLYVITFLYFSFCCFSLSFFPFFFILMFVQSFSFSPNSHPGYFGKLGMRHFHYKRNAYYCPKINVDTLWSLLPEEARVKREDGQVPVIDCTRHVWIYSLLVLIVMFVVNLFFDMIFFYFGKSFFGDFFPEICFHIFFL